MKIIAETFKSDLATVFVAEMQNKKYIEFVESTQPPLPREKKWVLIVSTLYGCPIGCSFCECGMYYNGKLSKEDIFAQIDYLVTRRFPDRVILVDKFKIQFARMGEPALNTAVLDVLDEFSTRYKAPNFLPSISTMAPESSDDFFERLLEIKKEKYDKSFQLQFSIHTTSETQRDKIIPVKKWSFDKMAEYADRFFTPGTKKITLNFAVFESAEIDNKILKNIFDPNKFIIKLTPINPTSTAKTNNIISEVFSSPSMFNLVKSLEIDGFEVILSVGEPEENKIGSNCGQFITNYMQKVEKLENAYNYPLMYSNDNISNN